MTNRPDQLKKKPAWVKRKRLLKQHAKAGWNFPSGFTLRELRRFWRDGYPVRRV